MTHGGAAPQVRAKAAERLADLIDPDRALREAAKLAYADIRDLYDEQGRLKSVKDFPDSIAAAVTSVETIKGNLDQGDGQLDAVARVRLVDKVKPLEMLFKHMGLLEERLRIDAHVYRWEGEDE